MNSTITIFSENTTSNHNDTVCISIEEFEHLMACKRELTQIKKDIKDFLGDDL